MKNITGSLIHTYFICKRKTWLFARQITGDQYNEFLAIGRLYSEETYKREKKEILIDANKIDIVSKKDNRLLLIETKKSSKMLEASKIQLLHYMYSFYRRGYDVVTGEIRIPKEKKIITVEFGEYERNILDRLYVEIDNLIFSQYPPVGEYRKICKKCSYNEFCWS